MEMLFQDENFVLPGSEVLKHEFAISVDIISRVAEDDRYRGWRLGFTDLISITPAQCFELVDGVIVY